MADKSDSTRTFRCEKCGWVTEVDRFAPEGLVQCGRCRQAVGVSDGLRVQFIVGLGVLGALVLAVVLFGRVSLDVRWGDEGTWLARLDDLAAEVLSYRERNGGQSPASLDVVTAQIDWVSFLGDEGMTLVYSDVFASGQIAATDARDYKPVLWIVGTFDHEERIPVAFVRGGEVVTRFVRVNSARTVPDDLRKAADFLSNERIPEVPPS